MSGPVTLNDKNFNYALLKEDVMKFVKKEGFTMEYISTIKLLRSKCYLSNALNKHILPANLLKPICEFIGTSASKYKIEPEKPKPEPKAEPTKAPVSPVVPTYITSPAPVYSVQELYAGHPELKPVMPNGWECQIRVDEDFETVMMKVTKNGEEMAISRCYFFSKDDMGIMQAISYAAHQAYKIFQQKVLAQQEADAVLRTEVKVAVEAPKKPSDVSCFKNWILKYKEDTSPVGRLARYCESMYDQVPSHGERKIRMFLQLEKNGYAHVAAFNAIWPLYMKEYRAAEVESSRQLVNDI